MFSDTYTAHFENSAPAIELKPQNTEHENIIRRLDFSDVFSI